MKGLSNLRLFSPTQLQELRHEAYFCEGPPPLRRTAISAMWGRFIIHVQKDKDMETYIYRASIRLRNGRRIYAKQYGLNAFRIKVRNPSPKQLVLPNLS